jgi:hypothetical protein
MIATYVTGLIFFSAFAALMLQARRQHGEAMNARHRLLDTARDVLMDCRIALACDRFPVATGLTRAGQQVKLELVADTMITRRLPQLWLKVTLLGNDNPERASVGALARPTGGEYYSVVHDMSEWLPPPAAATPLLMRGGSTVTEAEVAIAANRFPAMFTDPKLKEAAVLRRATRIVYQAMQGERAAHLFLRQARFACASVSAEAIVEAIRLAEELAAMFAADTASIGKAA